MASCTKASCARVRFCVAFVRDASLLSATTIARLKDVRIDEHNRWTERDLSAENYVYLWVDGVSCKRVWRTRRSASSSSSAPHRKARPTTLRETLKRASLHPTPQYYLT